MVGRGSERTEHAKVSNARLNSLRAAVLGANDGIVSVSSIILGVAGAGVNRSGIFAAGLAGLAAGALSMAVGEYVSVSSQRDTEQAYISEEKWHLEHHPEEEFNDLAATFEAKGLSPATARQVARELTEHDAVKAHIEAELHLDEEDLSSPTAAALASLIAFAIGGIMPLLAVFVALPSYRVVTVVAAVVAVLIVTGYLSAMVGHAPKLRAIVRIVIGGVAAMLITFGVGHLFGNIVG